MREYGESVAMAKRLRKLVNYVLPFLLVLSYITGAVGLTLFFVAVYAHTQVLIGPVTFLLVSVCSYLLIGALVKITVIGAEHPEGSS